MKNIEKEILQAIIKENSSNFSFLDEDFPYLYVKSREYTNSGIYINFGYAWKSPYFRMYPSLNTKMVMSVAVICNPNDRHDLLYFLIGL